MHHVPLSKFAASALKAAKPATMSGGPAVDTILMVGAMLSKTGTQVLSDPDEDHLVAIFKQGAKAGIPFHPEPSIAISNLTYGDDFLKDRNVSALVAFCMVFRDPRGMPQQAIDKRFYRQSELSEKDGAWHKACVDSQARWLVNIHRNEVELPTSCLHSPPYQIVHSGVAGGKKVDILGLSSRPFGLY